MGSSPSMCGKRRGTGSTRIREQHSFLDRARGEVLLHLGGQLTIRHFVSRFQFHDDATDLLGLHAFAELTLGFTRSKDQQRLCIRIQAMTSS